jgi:hypothetical protein
VAGEVSGGREPADVTDAADDDRSCQRADSVDVGDGAGGRGDHGRGPFADLASGVVEHADLVEHLLGCGDPLGGDAVVDVDVEQELFGFGDGQGACGAALDEQTQNGVEATDRARPVRGDLMITIGEQT